ncbi:FG-GAP repeat domain-containing protein, partial [Kocuria sp. NPDC057446]|uniref:FG-GAP repeat domain-containing protein n=1 Tax=Kocuria sp. NPDC057446 TaxID=3346137 RepID=UPI0036B9152E
MRQHSLRHVFVALSATSLMFGVGLPAAGANGDNGPGGSPPPVSAFAQNLVAQQAAGVTVRRSNGQRFLPNESWTTNPYYGSRGDPVYFADVTGDGRADAIVVNDDKVTVRRSNGQRFLPNESWTTNPYYGNKSTAFADVTGDGRADAIVVNDDKVTVRRSNGQRFL